MNWSIPRRPGGRAITYLLARAFIGRKLRACSDALVSCRGAAWLLFAGAVYELSLALLHVAGMTQTCSDVLPFNAFCFLVASIGMLRETGGSVRSTCSAGNLLPRRRFGCTSVRSRGHDADG